MPIESELETAKSVHEVFDLVGRRGSAEFQIALNAKDVTQPRLRLA